MNKGNDRYLYYSDESETGGEAEDGAPVRRTAIFGRPSLVNRTEVEGRNLWGNDANYSLYLHSR